MQMTSKVTSKDRLGAPFCSATAFRIENRLDAARPSPTIAGMIAMTLARIDDQLKSVVASRTKTPAKKKKTASTVTAVTCCLEGSRSDTPAKNSPNTSKTAVARMKTAIPASLELVEWSPTAADKTHESSAAMTRLSRQSPRRGVRLELTMVLEACKC